MTPPFLVLRLQWVPVLLLVARFPSRVSSIEDPCRKNFTVCPTSVQNGTCASENRTCLYDTATNQEECGNCLPGYIDLVQYSGKKHCQAIEEITFEEYESVVSPFYTTNNESLAASRLERLRSNLLNVSFVRATIPPLPYTQSVNRFSADLPQDYRGLAGHRTIENASQKLGFEPFPGETPAGRDLQAVPDAVDWVAAGAVTDVKNQGRCGCCWSISSVGAVEGATFITDTYIDSLSFQQLISCDTANYGCDGGSIAYAMQYCVSNPFKGLTLYTEYPFQDSDGTTTTTCETTGKNLSVEVFNPAAVASYSPNTYTLDERIQMFKSAVATQPVSITMNANCDTFNNYAGGVLTTDGDCSCQDTSCIDHAVLLVGYNDTYDPPYWYIKNSWGTDWGSEGYFYVSQQGGGDWGLFGILGEGVMALKAENVTGEVVETSSSPPSRFAAKTGWMKSSSWHALAVAFFASYCGALLLLSY